MADPASSFLDPLRRYKPATGTAVSYAMTLARRREITRATCVRDIVLYVVLGLVLVAWYVGLSQKLVLEAQGHPALFLVLVLCVMAATYALLPVLTPNLSAVINQHEARYRQAPAELFAQVTPMLDAVPEARVIVLDWMSALPCGLRMIEMNLLLEASEVWHSTRSHPGAELKESAMSKGPVHG